MKSKCEGIFSMKACWARREKMYGQIVEDEHLGDKIDAQQMEIVAFFVDIKEEFRTLVDCEFML